MRTAAACLATLALCVLAVPARAGSFVEFESGQVRPLALSPDGSRLFAVNTPDDRLEVFAVTATGLAHALSIPVGLEPVAVAARTNDEVWVVNHLSDSVSIVDLAATPPHVTRTLLVGDEPRDIVFAGPGGTRAFVTTAHRGQNDPIDPQLTTPGVGRADVWVFDATNLGTTLGGAPLTIVTLFGDTPRALATDGSTVWAAVFQSGNQTSAISAGVVCPGGAAAPPCTIFGVTYPGGLPAPNTNVELVQQPEVGLVVKYDQGTGRWEDTLGRDWSNAVKFSLPDLDVFAIDANAPTPAQTASYAHVGTVLFNMAVNPVSGKVYVSNTDAHNEVRFEGPGVFGGSSVHGHLAEARITVLDGASVLPRHLNKHIDYSIVPSPPGTKDASLATPTGMAVSSDGATLYVAAFGTSAVGVFKTAELEADTFTPSAASHWPVSGGGPSGVVLDDAHGRLYVLTRFDDSVSVLDTSSGMEEAHLPLFNPEPPSITNGRRFLYDAQRTSSNGEASCSSCHIFGDFDSLAWDLGNPDDVVTPEVNPFRVVQPPSPPAILSFPNFHPMKGPMTTQTLRGMANNGPMHWRGDRTGGLDNPPHDPLDEDAAFKRFNVAFQGLLGNDGPLTDAEMQAYTDFILQVTLPPNPIRHLDNSLTSDQQAGRNFFMSTKNSDVFEPCHGCHALDPANGHFGTDGFSSFEQETQLFKIPHLRNLYQKVGMFGMPAIAFTNTGNNGDQGPQVRGFGFLHDGSIDTVFRFHNADVFDQVQFGFNINPNGFPNGAPGDPLRRQVEQFMFAFDSNLAPIVGQQVTLGPTSGADAQQRADLMMTRCRLGECDVVVKGPSGGIPRGWVRTGATTFQSDRAGEVDSDAVLRAAAAAGEERTYMAVPPGSGIRIGIDRDEDGAFDQDEVDLGTDPADPASSPLVRASARRLEITNALPDVLAKNRITILSKDAKISPPAPGSAGDPRCGADPAGTVKATITVSSAASGQHVTADLPCQNWTLVGGPRSPASYRYVDTKLADGTAKRVTWQRRSLKVQLSGKGATALGYDLQVGTSENPVSAELEVTGGVAGVCVECTGSGHADGGDGKKFLGRTSTCPAPAACPSASVVSSPSGAFL